MKTIRILFTIILLAFTSTGILADLPSKRVLTLDVAKKIAEAAEVEAKKRGSTVVIVVVVDGGYPLVLHRLDDTQVASVEVGIGKARTAAIFRRPSKVFEEQVRNGRVAALALLVLSFSALAQDPAPIYPENYKVITENDRVRVMDFKLRKGAKEDFHAQALEDHKLMPHLKASFKLRQEQGWMTEITTWKQVREDVQPMEQARKD